LISLVPVDEKTGFCDFGVEVGWAGDNGKIALTVRYGAKVLELVKNKNAIEVASASELVKTLELVKTATAAGELDDAIAAASAKLRSGFGK